MIEDNAVNQRLVQAFLEEAGHTPVLASSAREGIAALERETFDAVLMDVEMPDMNGFQATAAIRAREAPGARTPILAVTAHTSREYRQRCLAAGMDGYISKPIHYEDLIGQIESSVSRDRATPPAASPPAPGLGERKGLRKELTVLFVADAQRLQGEMRDAIERLDGDGLQLAAHTLLGTAGLFMAQRVCDLARRLEELGRARDFGLPTGHACQELAEELARLEQLLGADRPS